jgi:predicted nuclease of predicted toxin-antitoxin system
LRFLLDESADGRISAYLQEGEHDVARIGWEHPSGLPDHEVLAIAYRERRILITRDRDFAELVFVHFQPHNGVILLRLGSSPQLATIRARLGEVLSQHAPELDQFIVLTPNLIRIRR